MLFNACMTYYLNLDFLFRMILAMFNVLGRVERVLNTSILVNTDLVQTYRTTLFVMMFVDYLFDSLLSDADDFFLWRCSS